MNFYFCLMEEREKRKEKQQLCRFLQQLVNEEDSFPRISSKYRLSFNINMVNMTLERTKLKFYFLKIFDIQKRNNQHDCSKQLFFREHGW